MALPAPDEMIEQTKQYRAERLKLWEFLKQKREEYAASARRFADIVRKTGADVLLSNHTIFDGSKTKLPALAGRTPGSPNPYVIGTDSVTRFLKVAEECAAAIRLQLP